MNSRKCYLLHIATKKKINLPHGQIKTIGRTQETEIQDLFISKSQIECVADIKECKVRIKPVGRSICGIDGYAVLKDKTYTIGHGHRIELRLGFHCYEIVFEPPPDLEENDLHVAKKQKIEFPIFNMKKDVNSTTKDEVIDAVPVDGKWEAVDHKELIIYTPRNIIARSKIAAFDVDGTIINTKSGARFPKNGDDWILYLNDIPQQLQKLHEQDFKIAFFTNQSGIGKDSFKIKDFKRKIENILQKISVPVQVFVALGKSIYRKPAPGMWNVLTSNKNEDVIIDLDNSFYVGDAAGREKNWAPKRNKDHSCADRLFALNIGVKFYTPEEYFLKAKSVAYIMPEFDPRNLPVKKHPKVDFETPNVIVMVGGPGSGKSHFCRNVLIPKGYIHINRDTLGTWQKCVKSLEENLQYKRNCVIDNTNVDKESRARFIEVAKKFNTPCRCFVMMVDLKQAKHNNKFRELTDSKHVPVSDIIINSLNKNYQAPELSEGFEDIVEVPFTPKFDTDEYQKLYKMFLMEK